MLSWKLGLIHAYHQFGPPPCSTLPEAYWQGVQERMVWAHAQLLKQNPAAFSGSSPPELSANIYQQAASELKALSWQHEFESDEVACAVLARLRLPPEQWVAALKHMRAEKLAEMGSWITAIDSACKSRGRRSKQTEAALAALAARMGWNSVKEGVAQLKAALAKGDLSLLEQQGSRWMARMAWEALLDADDEEGGIVVCKTAVPSDMIVGPAACPEPAVLAMLSDLADTSPPIETRIERILLLATQHGTALPAERGGHDESSSMAQAIAKRAIAGRQAAVAAQHSA